MSRNRHSILYLLLVCSFFYACSDCGEAKFPTNFELQQLDFRSQLLDGRVVDTSSFEYFDSVYTIIYVSKVQVVSMVPKKNWSLFTQAYACEPLFPYTKDRLKTISIIATANVTDSIAINITKGDTINNYFVVLNYDGNFVPMGDLPLGISSQNQQWVFKWNTKPAKQLNIPFNIRVELSNGKHFLIQAIQLKIR